MPIRDCTIGESVKIWEPVNLYGCYICEGTTIGAFTEIGRDVYVGKRCKIEAGCFIPFGVFIEDEVFVGPHTVFCNDKHPKAVGEWKPGSVLVKKGASIGANSTILPGVIIGENAMVGAGSVVTKDVEPGTLVVGNPAREV